MTAAIEMFLFRAPFFQMVAKNSLFFNPAQISFANEKQKWFGLCRSQERVLQTYSIRKEQRSGFYFIISSIKYNGKIGSLHVFCETS